MKLPNTRKLFIALLILLIALCLHTASTAETVDSGTCGNNVTWNLDSSGTLTISGTGVILNHPWTKYAWNKNKIEKVIINQGVTGITDESFYSCLDLSEVTIPEGVTYIGRKAFCSCDALISISIPTQFQSI